MRSSSVKFRRADFFGLTLTPWGIFTSAMADFRSHQAPKIHRVGPAVSGPPWRSSRARCGHQGAWPAHPRARTTSLKIETPRDAPPIESKSWRCWAVVATPETPDTTPARPRRKAPAVRWQHGRQPGSRCSRLITLAWNESNACQTRSKSPGFVSRSPLVLKMKSKFEPGLGASLSMDSRACDRTPRKSSRRTITRDNHTRYKSAIQICNRFPGCSLECSLDCSIFALARTNLR